METLSKTVLVTGATSGIGFETAALLAEEGFTKIFIGSRTRQKGEAARRALVSRTGKQVFELFVADVAEADVTQTAVDQLLEQGESFDLLVLNAGASTAEPRFNADGVELTFASTLIGHHVLTMRLLEAEQLNPEGRIVIAGSEGARGDVPGMQPVDIYAFAAQHFGGDLEAALEAIARVEPPFKFKPFDAYVTAKVFVAWWAAALARRLPAGMTVNAVSPGSVPTTNFARNQNILMRSIIMPLIGKVGKPFGIASSLADGAQRYIDIGTSAKEVSGKFFASAPKKMTGPLHIMQHPHFLDEQLQESFWPVLERLSRAPYPMRQPVLA